MLDNASPKWQMLVASMDIQQDTNNYMDKNQQNHSILSKDIRDLSFQRTLGMSDHTQLKRQDNNVAFLDM